jgi:hypothetical protein
LAQVREKLDALDAMAIEITPTTIVFKKPPQSNQYRVVSERDGVLGIAVENDDNYAVIFVDDDHMETRNSRGRRLPFTRVGAESKRPADGPVAAQKDWSPSPGPEPRPRRQSQAPQATRATRMRNASSRCHV